MFFRYGTGCFLLMNTGLKVNLNSSSLVAWAAICSVVVHSLLLSLFVGFCVQSLFCNELLSVFSSFSVISLKKRELAPRL